MLAVAGLLLVSVSCGSGGAAGAPAGSGSGPASSSAASASYRGITSCGDVAENVRLDADLATTGATCLTVRSSGVTIEGAGHRITAGRFAVLVNNLADLTLRNVVSGAGVQIYGAGARGGRIENSEVGSVGVFMADDVVLRDNRMSELTVQGLNNDPPLRTVITRNIIEGAREDLVYLSPNGDGAAVCVVSGIVFSENVVRSSLTEVPADNGQNLLYLRCGMHNSIVRNTFRSDAKATGIYMRDEADDNVIEHNLVWVNQSVRAALHFSSGNANKHHPRGNQIRDNVFRADAARSIWIQARGFADNRFTSNVFWGAAPEGGRISGGSGNVFDHNTFVNDAAGSLLVLEAFTAPGNTYTSNIFAHDGGTLYQLSGQFDFSGYRGDRNVFFDRSGPVAFHKGWPLAEWRSRSAADAGSIEADPQFADPQGGDFSVAAGSPARGAGATRSAVGAP